LSLGKPPNTSPVNFLLAPQAEEKLVRRRDWLVILEIKGLEKELKLGWFCAGVIEQVGTELPGRK
jgi:hypothetical protein